MPQSITPDIEQFYEDEEILTIIAESPNLTAQFNEPDVANSDVCVVLPQVYRGAGYQRDQFNLDVILKHDQVTEFGQYEMYRVKDFIRQRVDVGPVLHAVQQVTGVDVKVVMDSIKKQIKFLQKPENRNLPVAPAQMVNL